MKLACVASALLLLATAGHAQNPASPFVSPVTRDIASGEMHEYPIRAAAGDLIAGTLELRELAGVVEFRDSADRNLKSFYQYDPQQRRIGFVAPASGEYRVQIKAYDGFTEGPQTDPGVPIPVITKRRGTYTLRLDQSVVAVRMRDVQVPERQTIQSSRLRQLSADLERGHTAALAEFWREVSGKGPLVETISGNEQDVDVTFLWRETYDTRNVLVYWAMSGTDYYMTRLPATDAWYKTLRLRRGSRFSYAISPNDKPADRALTAQLDPLNPRLSPDDPTYRFERSSVLETAGAPDESWFRNTPTQRGKIEQSKFKSTLLKNERDIWIYTPPGYTAAKGPYPFLLLFDGAAYVSSRWLNAPATLNNLIGAGRIEPVIVCFIPAVNRGVEQGFAGADAYGEAIVQELLPKLRSAYAITTDPKKMTLGGYSNGGMAAALIALRHSDVFANVLSQSGSFRARRPGSGEPNSVAQMYLAERRLPIRFYLETGLYDTVPSAGLPLHEMVLDETNTMGNRHLRDVLLAKGYDVTYRETGGSHEWVHWRSMLADGLMALLQRR